MNHIFVFLGLIVQKIIHKDKYKHMVLFLIVLKKEILLIDYK